MAETQPPPSHSAPPDHVLSRPKIRFLLGIQVKKFPNNRNQQKICFAVSCASAIVSCKLAPPMVLGRLLRLSSSPAPLKRPCAPPPSCRYSVAAPGPRQARLRVGPPLRAIWCSNCWAACRSLRKKTAVCAGALMWPTIMIGKCAPRWKSCAAIWMSAYKPWKRGLAGRPPRALLSRGRRRKLSQSRPARQPPAPPEPLTRPLRMAAQP